MSAQPDKNLVFVMLALQLDYIDQAQLIDAANAWMMDKSHPIGHVLVQRKLIAEEDAALLQNLVEKHLARCGSAEESMARLVGHATIKETGSSSPLAQSLGHIFPEAADFLETVSFTPSGKVDASLRYRIIRGLAKGGLGMVSVARDTELDREVAIKELLPGYGHSHEAQTRFLAEAIVTGGLEHPGIVPIYGLGSYADGRSFYAMRLIRGRSMQRAIEEIYGGSTSRSSDSQPPATLERPSSHANPIKVEPIESSDAMQPSSSSLKPLTITKLQWMAQVRPILHHFIDACNALAYAHNRGVLHRDLKPSNIMLGKFGETLVVDWGLAKAQQASPSSELVSEAPITSGRKSGNQATMMGSILGTPAFMSPEQAMGRIDRLDARSDIFSLGATLYSILTGLPPYHSRNRDDVLSAARRGDYAPIRSLNPRVPKELEAVCRKALALDPKDRYATATDLAAEVERCIAGDPVDALPESAVEKMVRFTRRHQGSVLTTLIALVIGLVGLGILTRIIQTQRNEARHLRTVADNESKHAIEEAEHAIEASQRADRNAETAVSLVGEFVAKIADNQWAQFPGMDEKRLEMLNAASEKLMILLESSPEDNKIQTLTSAVLLRTANAHRAIGKLEESLAILEKITANASTKQDVEKDNTFWLDHRCDLLFYSPGVIYAMKGPTTAKPLCHQGLAQCRTRCELRPDDYLAAFGYFRQLLLTAEYELETSHFQEASSLLDEATSLFKKWEPKDSMGIIKLFAADSGKLQFKLALYQGDTTLARQRLEDALDFARDYAGSFSPRDLKNAIFDLQVYRCMMLDKAAKTAQALDEAEFCQATFERLALENPTFARYQRGLCHSALEHALLLAKQGEREGVEACMATKQRAWEEYGKLRTNAYSLAVTTLEFLHLEHQIALALSDSARATQVQTSIEEAASQLAQFNPEHPLLKDSE